MESKDLGKNEKKCLRAVFSKHRLCPFFSFFLSYLPMDFKSKDIIRKGNERAIFLFGGFWKKRKLRKWVIFK